MTSGSEPPPPVRRPARPGGGLSLAGTRTCVGCRQEAGKHGLIRLVRRPGGGAAVDPGGRAHGRGAYLHADPTCIESARKRRALDRALKTQIQPELWSQLIS